MYYLQLITGEFEGYIDTLPGDVGFEEVIVCTNIDLKELPAEELVLVLEDIGIELEEYDNQSPLSIGSVQVLDENDNFIRLSGTTDIGDYLMEIEFTQDNVDKYFDFEEKYNIYKKDGFFEPEEDISPEDLESLTGSVNTRLKKVEINLPFFYLN